MRDYRPAPFRSPEGCFLSNTVRAVALLIGLVGGGLLGYGITNTEEGARWGGVFGGVLLGFTPWRRWVVDYIRRRRGSDRNAP